MNRIFLNLIVAASCLATLPLFAVPEKKMTVPRNSYDTVIAGSRHSSANLSVIPESENPISKRTVWAGEKEVYPQAGYISRMPPRMGLTSPVPNAPNPHDHFSGTVMAGERNSANSVRVVAAKPVRSPYHYHRVTPIAISKKGKKVRLSDGSFWKVNSSDRRIVEKWSGHDLIVVKSETFLFWTNYKLKNLANGTSIRVEPSQP